MNETEKSVQFLAFSDHCLSNYPILIDAILNVKSAAAAANFKGQRISAEVLEKIQGGLAELKQLLKPEFTEARRNTFPVDLLAGGGCFSIHINILEAASRVSGVSIADLNASQSTADVCYSAFRIAIFRQAQKLVAVLEPIGRTLSLQAHAWEDISTLSRTCLQDALPVSFGESWSAHATALKRRRDVIESDMQALLRMNMGGTVIGSGAGASATYRQCVVQELIGVTDLPLSSRDNFYDAAQSSDDLGSFHSSLTQLVQVLMKLARDLRLLSSGPRGGLGELTLPRIQEGSSFFAGKTNPILPETLLQCGFQVLGGEAAIQVAQAHSELNLNVFDGFIGTIVLDSLQSLIQCLPKFHQHCLSGVEVQRTRCEELSQFHQQLKPKE